ncbi:hypothetical protein BC833DRAFT_611495 [Globomyces pollinis-pini]|nr:hypothetical protein BC833DRAFT_611495 [Globomyces pollinis-pini]
MLVTKVSFIISNSKFRFRLPMTRKVWTNNPMLHSQHINPVIQQSNTRISLFYPTKLILNTSNQQNWNIFSDPSNDHQNLDHPIINHLLSSIPHFYFQGICTSQYYHKNISLKYDEMVICQSLKSYKMILALAKQTLHATFNDFQITVLSCKM